jgi:phospholipase/lecithinase/hemolysin
LVDNIERTNPDVNIVEIDVNELVDEIFDNPGEFGLTHVTDNFSGIDLYADLNQPPASGNPNEYFYWDSVHPTTTVHNLVADLVLDELSSEDLIA